MEQSDTIIDITPVDHSNKRTAPQHSPAQEIGSSAARTPGKGYYTFDGTSWRAGTDSAQAAPKPGTATPVDAHVIDSAAADQPKSRLGGAARIAAGGVCALVGIPMLILPGPGLLAIGGGAYLMASGAKRLFGK